MSATLQLKYWGDPILSQICEPIHDSEFGSKLEEFGNQMIATMLASDGVGLAAPQVGVSTQIFILAFPESKGTKEPIIVCNPTLTLSGDTIDAVEGCLSLPTIFDVVPRAKNTTLKYFCPDGTEDELELSDLDARVAQHEYDHLLGVVFPERLSRQMRRAAARDWAKIQKKYLG